MRHACWCCLAVKYDLWDLQLRRNKVYKAMKLFLSDGFHSLVTWMMKLFLSDGKNTHECWYSSSVKYDVWDLQQSRNWVCQEWDLNPYFLTRTKTRVWHRLYKEGHKLFCTFFTTYNYILYSFAHFVHNLNIFRIYYVPWCKMLLMWLSLSLFLYSKNCFYVKAFIFLVTWMLILLLKYTHVLIS